MGYNKIINILKNKIFIAVIAFILIVGIISIIYIIFTNQNTNNNQSKDPTITSIYIDPGSGETVVNMPNQTPEKADYSGDGIIMLGFSKLIDDYGMTFDQVTKLQSEFSDYSSSQKTPLQEISITLASIETTVDPDTGYVIYKFNVTINRSSTLIAEVKCFGISDPVLVLYSPKDNSLLYNSTI